MIQIKNIIPADLKKHLEVHKELVTIPQDGLAGFLNYNEMLENRIQKYFRILAGIGIFCLLCFLFYKNYLVHKAIYFQEYSGRIEKVDKYIKGDWGVYVDKNWRYLGLDGRCIDTLYVGDSIIKKPKSYSIIIKSKVLNFKATEYDCNKGYHFY